MTDNKLHFAARLVLHCHRSRLEYCIHACTSFPTGGGTFCHLIVGEGLHIKTVKVRKTTVSSMNHWNLSTHAPTAAQGSPVYYTQYAHLPHSATNTSSAPHGSYVPVMPAPSPFPASDPATGFYSPFQAPQAMILPESYHVTSPSIYQVLNASLLLSRTPTIPPTPLTGLDELAPLQQAGEPGSVTSVPTTKQKRKAPQKAAVAPKRWKKAATNTAATVTACPPPTAVLCGVGPTATTTGSATTLDGNASEHVPPLHIYTDPTMTACGRGSGPSNPRKNSATDVWHFLMSVPSTNKPDVLPDITKIPTLTSNPGMDSCKAMACRLCM